MRVDETTVDLIVIYLIKNWVGTASHVPLESPFVLAMDAWFNSALCFHYTMLHVLKAYFKRHTVEVRHMLCNHRLSYKGHNPYACCN